MCPPAYFDVSYDINPWMTDNQNNVDKILATKQWNKLYEALREVATVNLIDPQPGLPDMVFTANAGFCIENQNLVIVSNFRNMQRKKEEQYFIEWFRYYGYSTFFPTTPFEGEGDLLTNYGDNHWIGYGFRSSKDLTSLFPFSDLQSLKEIELVDPRFYHLDTCFMPLGDKGALWYPEAFSNDSQELIRKNIVKELSVEVTEEEALTFCCNAVVIEDKVFMPECDSVAKKLSAIGYKVQQFEMSEFLKSGGACKCLVMKMG
jgi:ornithine--oxo-acid transaminase